MDAGRPRRAVLVDQMTVLVLLVMVLLEGPLYFGCLAEELRFGVNVGDAGDIWRMQNNDSFIYCMYRPTFSELYYTDYRVTANHCLKISTNFRTTFK